MNVRQRLSELRDLMKRHRLDAYLVPSSDPHQSEYLPENWKRREFISGFSGSAGDIVITSKEAALWTDSRYFVQAKLELRGSGVRLMKLGMRGTPSIAVWLASTLKRGSRVGCDPRVHSYTQYQALEKSLSEHGLKLIRVKSNLVDQVWQDQPPRSANPIVVHPIKYAGETVASKLKKIRTEMKKSGATVHVIAALDAVAWLYNLRGTDINFNPVAVSYAMVTRESAYLFTDPRKVTPEVKRALGKRVQIRRYDSLQSTLRRLGKRSVIWIDPASTSQWIVSSLPATAKKIFKPSPIVMLRACKNETEIRGSAQAHVRDGVALVRFLHWLDINVGKTVIDEVSAAEKLESFRARSRMYRGPSFDPIVGYGAHGAIIHYSAKPRTCSKLRARGQALLDTGGQYPDGTTDVTRTVALGNPTAEQKEHFTRVLKGHIAVATACFPAGTTGSQLDAFARRSLWDAGLNYGHGTGHGVGSYLCVHEGPHRIAPVASNVALKPGMIMSNEPGSYLEGKFGVRIENLIYVTKDRERSTNNSEFYRFENLTLCPIDTRLIDKKLLTADEIRCLNQYHATVRAKLLRFLNTADAKWLRRATRKI